MPNFGFTVIDSKFTDATTGAITQADAALVSLMTAAAADPSPTNLMNMSKGLTYYNAALQTCSTMYQQVKDAIEKILQKM